MPIHCSIRKGEFSVKVAAITVGESVQLQGGQKRSVKLSVELAAPLGIEDTEELIAAESKVRSQLQRILGADLESVQAMQDIRSLERKRETLQGLVGQERKRLSSALQKWKLASDFLRLHGINPDGWEFRFLPQLAREFFTQTRAVAAAGLCTRTV
jgi:hypothetical protein